MNFALTYGLQFKLSDINDKSGRAMKFGLKIITLIFLFLTLSDIGYSHGERAQEPFLRMRTIQWYDVSWSTKELAVNETLIVKGRFRVSQHWPSNVAKPEGAFLNISIPGPVFVRKLSLLNGVNMINSTSLEIGRDYEWEVQLKARIPGTWHVHSMLNIEGAGPLVGPGKYVKITGDYANFKNEVTTIEGQRLDLESYGLARNISWHLVWAAFGLLWLGYWLWKPNLIERYRIVRSGDAKSLITENNIIIGIITLVFSLGITTGAYQMAENKWPRTIALQSSRATVKPSPQKEERVEVELVKAIYNVPGRSMKMKIKVTNTTMQPIRVGEFATATVRFINPEVGLVDEEASLYPKYLLALKGLRVNKQGAILPGETKVIEVTARDAAWVTERLSSLISDPDSHFGGLLFFYGETGQRFISSVGGAVSPRFL